MKANCENSHWEVEVSYALPTWREEGEIYWDEYVEKCYVFIPAHIEGERAALQYLEDSSLCAVNLLSATRVSVESNQ